MKTTLSAGLAAKSWNYPLLALGSVFLVGCVTAKIPSGQDVYVPQVHPDKPKIAVARCKDTRASEKAGSVGLASISVKKQDLENLVSACIVEYLNRHLDLNVERVNAEKPEEVKGLAASLAVKGLLLGKITKLEISSADAAMDPADVVLECEVSLYDGTGGQIFREVLTGKHTEWVGFKLVDKATGRLAEAAARDLAHQLGLRLDAKGVVKLLN